MRTVQNVLEPETGRRILKRGPLDKTCLRYAEMYRPAPQHEASRTSSDLECNFTYPLVSVSLISECNFRYPFSMPGWFLTVHYKHEKLYKLFVLNERFNGFAYKAVHTKVVNIFLGPYELWLTVHILYFTYTPLRDFKCRLGVFISPGKRHWFRKILMNEMESTARYIPAFAWKN
jgi:hypothetical protein